MSVTSLLKWLLLFPFIITLIFPFATDLSLNPVSKEELFIQNFFFLFCYIGFVLFPRTIFVFTVLVISLGFFDVNSDTAKHADAFVAFALATLPLVVINLLFKERLKRWYKTWHVARLLLILTIYHFILYLFGHFSTAGAEIWLVINTAIVVTVEIIAYSISKNSQSS